MIKVVHITENPIAGAPISLTRALNKWQGDKIQARHIAVSDRNENRIFHSDLLIGEGHKEEIFRVLQEADIIHFHNFWQNQELFRKWPELWSVVMGKKRVWQAHTQRDIAWVSMEDGLRDKNTKHLVIGQYHPRMYPECTVVPNIVDIFDPLLMPIDRHHPKLRVVYTPSRIGLKGWDDKGYHETAPVLQKLVDKGVITANIVFNKPHAECLKEKQAAHVGIDEVITGSYHLCSLETLSQGAIAIANLDDIQVKTLKDLTGASWLPWVKANPSTLENALLQLASDGDEVARMCGEARRWMETYWHPKITTQKFVDIYESM